MTDGFRRVPRLAALALVPLTLLSACAGVPPARSRPVYRYYVTVPGNVIP